MINTNTNSIALKHSREEDSNETKVKRSKQEISDDEQLLCIFKIVTENGWLTHLDILMCSMTNKTMLKNCLEFNFGIHLLPSTNHPVIRRIPLIASCLTNGHIELAQYWEQHFKPRNDHFLLCPTFNPQCPEKPWITKINYRLDNMFYGLTKVTECHEKQKQYITRLLKVHAVSFEMVLSRLSISLITAMIENNNSNLLIWLLKSGSYDQGDTLDLLIEDHPSKFEMFDKILGYISKSVIKKGVVLGCRKQYERITWNAFKIACYKGRIEHYQRLCSSFPTANKAIILDHVRISIVSDQFEMFKAIVSTRIILETSPTTGFKQIITSLCSLGKLEWIVWLLRHYSYLDDSYWSPVDTRNEILEFYPFPSESQAYFDDIDNMNDDQLKSFIVKSHESKKCQCHNTSDKHKLHARKDLKYSRLPYPEESDEEWSSSSEDD